MASDYDEVLYFFVASFDGPCRCHILIGNIVWCISVTSNNPNVHKGAYTHSYFT